MEDKLLELEEKYNKLEKKVLQLEFRQELMMSDTNTNRVLLEYNITKKEYEKIMDIMDKYRGSIEKKQKVNNAEFEQDIYKVVSEHQGDYHFCEYISKAFMDDDRWEEVFPALYGDMPKYKYIKENKLK
ncbi:hypothetical protein SAMN04487886_100933 [Clostridium sp. DSM 8431]|uniref:DUF1878 domain-containing protein n=1 Tax=Clostridium sp. DSM 8431 TaxID=1761781 RepID=UPI0008E07EB6|nr:DUF1878 domain-containing protein [Clostridium sp. DSM 8431]SFU33951.1 hypothetical protein SAMN04487886_100933 [Clostridium sp. DSM 8431]